jgi:hypothetical protein
MVLDGSYTEKTKSVGLHGNMCEQCDLRKLWQLLLCLDLHTLYCADLRATSVKNYTHGSGMLIYSDLLAARAPVNYC